MLKYVFLLIASVSLFSQFSARVITAKSEAGIEVKAAIPSHDVFTAVEIEMEEDENFSHSSEDLNSEFTTQSRSAFSSYEAILRTRFLQLLSSFEQQPTSPLFVLHHSWKDSIA